MRCPLCDDRSPWLRRIAFLHSRRSPHMRYERHLSRVGQERKKWPVISLSLLFCVIWPAVGLLIGRHEAATDYWQDGYFILPDSFASSLDTRATARSPHSLTSLTHAYAHCHSRAYTYATRNTMPRYCDIHVFPHLLKVRLLNMLHSIRPDYVII